MRLQTWDWQVKTQPDGRVTATCGHCEWECTYPTFRGATRMAQRHRKAEHPSPMERIMQDDNSAAQ